ncbi:hypothetical protein LINPERHAP1_LOCUS15427 [Linum perenne]
MIFFTLQFNFQFYHLQGRAVDESLQRVRSPLSPLTETRSLIGLFPKSPRDSLVPRSSLLYSSASSQLLPPLNFSSSGLLTPRTLVPPNFSDQDNSESVGSVSDYTAENFSVYDGDEEVGSAADVDYLENRGNVMIMKTWCLIKGLREN